MPRPMKMIRFSRGSPSAQGAAKAWFLSMWTHWMTSFSSLPAMCSTALIRRKSLACSSVPKYLFRNCWKRCMLTAPVHRTPTLETVRSIFGFTHLVLNSSSSICCSSSTLERLKAPTLKSFSTGTTAFRHLIISAFGLSCFTRLSMSDSSFSPAKSILLTRTVLENAIWAHAVPFASGSPWLSSSFSMACFASTRATTLSTEKACLTSGFTKKVWTTGAGSAMPVSSMSTPSRWSPSAYLFAMPLRVFTRSLRIVQQTHPLSNRISSPARSVFFCSTSASSMLTSPTSFSITASFLSRCSRSK
mmetsp:Transcript_84838/g.252879  ORF Transcript_84838/g.252879 Transcript_84838/m.252879 type:complete len:303 (-) Transcript_84838:125-1033(-)